MRARLEYQAGHAIVWRDAVVQYFLKLSGIADERGRAGKFPGKAGSGGCHLSGYTVIDVQPWEDASRGKAVSCAPEANGCSAEWTWSGQPGRFDIAVQYFDLQGGTAKFGLTVNGTAVGTWAADAKLPSRRPNGDNSSRVYGTRGSSLSRATSSAWKEHPTAPTLLRSITSSYAVTAQCDARHIQPQADRITLAAAICREKSSADGVEVRSGGRRAR